MHFTTGTFVRAAIIAGRPPDTLRMASNRSRAQLSSSENSGARWINADRRPRQKL